MRKAYSVRLRRHRLLFWGLALSLLVHFVLIPMLLGFFGLHRAVVEPKTQMYQISTSLRLARVSKPQPHPRPRPQTPAREEPRPAQQPQPLPKPRIAQAPPRRELAKIDERAHIAVPHLSRQIDLAQQQVQFEKTIAQLRRQSDPLTGAARPVETPAAPKRFAFDFRGSVGTSPQAEGILTPVKSWRDGPYTYYYVRYWVQYADGTTESGYVPWPLRYLPQTDPFLLHWEHFPLPAPLPDYVLPSDTDLRPLVAYCYEHRSEFSDCPIARD